MKTCIYCGILKTSGEFSKEHIWPDALGGNYLPSLWHTDDVCRVCNNLAGVFVDALFIKSWLGAAERASSAMVYLQSDPARRPVFPLHYIGQLEDVIPAKDEIAELWVGPCGANIVHIKPENKEGRWNTYVGGDPRKNKSKHGRAYIALTSEHPFWIFACLISFESFFEKTERFVVNMDVPQEWANLGKRPDISDPIIAADMKLVTAVTSAAQRGESPKCKMVAQLDAGDRFLAKLGLAIGYKVLGEDFLSTEYAMNLRKGFREADHVKRRAIPVKGIGYTHGRGLGGIEKVLSWDGAWVLMIAIADHQLFLCVISPSGKPMSILICDQQSLVGKADACYREGAVWLTVPSLGEAFGPIPVESYIAHKTNVSPHAELVSLECKRLDRSLLPPCKPNEPPPA
jgi:hypothetical protein